MEFIPPWTSRSSWTVTEPSYAGWELQATIAVVRVRIGNTGNNVGADLFNGLELLSRCFEKKEQIIHSTARAG